MKSRESAVIQIEILPENFFIFVGRAADTRLFGLHAMYIALGNRDSNEQFASRHSVVALGIRGRNRTLVTPEDVNLGPVHLAAKFIGGENFEHLPRSTSAG